MYLLVCCFEAVNNRLLHMQVIICIRKEVCVVSDKCGWSCPAGGFTCCCGSVRKQETNRLHLSPPELQLSGSHCCQRSASAAAAG